MFVLDGKSKTKTENIKITSVIYFCIDTLSINQSIN